MFSHSLRAVIGALLAITLIATSEPFGRAMVLKSILLGVTNLGGEVLCYVW